MEVSTEFVGVAVGDKFSSFDTLSNKIKRAEDASFVQLYLRDSRTLDAAKKRTPKIAAQASEILKYHSITYSCIFGGKEHKTGSKGIRTSAQ